jgi:CheY-like chemotaxis protein
VLIADDDPASLRVTRLQVERLGHAADAVENGAAAVEAVMQRDYQVVLMDCQMPVMNGLVATAEIRRLKGADGPAIVAVTAEAGKDWEQRCRQAGMNEVLAKPVRTHVLAEILNRYARTSFPTGDRVDSAPASATAGSIDDLVADVGIELMLELAREYLSGAIKAVEALGADGRAVTAHDAHRLLGGARTLNLAAFARSWRQVEGCASSNQEISGTTLDELRRARVDLESWLEKHDETQLV